MAIGYDNTPVLYGTLLDLPFYEGTGVLAHDISRPSALDKTATLSAGCTWEQLALSNLTVIDLTSATPDMLTILAASCTDLNFTTGAFSGCAWIYPHVLVGSDRHILDRGFVNTDGWAFLVEDTGELTFRTNQAGANQVTSSAAGLITINSWWFVAFARNGADGDVYYNLATCEATSGVHVNPLTAARDLHIGTSNAHANSFDGLIWRPRIWNRALTTTEFRYLFEMERDRFGI